METIPKSDCTKVGFIRKTHGVQGELALEYEPEYEASVDRAERFFVEVEGLLVPFFVTPDGLRFKSSKTALVTFDWLTDETQARRLVGNAVYLYTHELIEDEEELAVAQLTGYRLLDENNQEVGVIAAVDDFAGNVVLTLEAGGREILVPFNEELLLELDDQAKILRLRLPEGLLD